MQRLTHLIFILGLFAAEMPAYGEPYLFDQDHLIINLQFEVNRAPTTVGNPTSLAPDIFYRPNDKWLWAFTHSHQAQGRLEAGHGICPGSFDRCDSPLANSRIELFRRLLHGTSWQVVASSGIDISSWSQGKWGLVSALHLQLNRPWFRIHTGAVLEANITKLSEGNRSRMVLPLWASLRLGSHAQLGIFVSLDSTLENWTENYVGPAALFAAARLANVDFRATFGFPRAIGPRQLAVRRTFVWSVAMRF